MKLTIELPWPDRALSPNARVHWRVKAKAVKAARASAKLAAYLAMRKAKWPKAVYDEAVTQIVFTQKIRRRIDRDNCLSSCKAYLDGLADAGVIKDDCGFTHKPIRIEQGPFRKIVIEIEAGANDQAISA